MKTLIISLLMVLILSFFMSCTLQGQVATSKPTTPIITNPTPTGTSTPDPLTESVIKADLIVLGTITDKKYETVTIGSGNTTGKYTYTIFTLVVEKVIKGDPTTTQVSIKTLGFETDPSYFLLKDKILVLLNRQNDNYYTLSKWGLQWFESPSTGAKPIVNLQEAIGHIIQIMKVNNVPITLPTSEWPTLPTDTIHPSQSP
jgi:hypothetical protein